MPKRSLRLRTLRRRLALRARRRVTLGQTLGQGVERLLDRLPRHPGDHPLAHPGDRAGYAEIAVVVDERPLAVLRLQPHRPAPAHPTPLTTRLDDDRARGRRLLVLVGQRALPCILDGTDGERDGRREAPTVSARLDRATAGNGAAELVGVGQQGPDLLGRAGQELLSG